MISTVLSDKVHCNIVHNQVGGRCYRNLVERPRDGQSKRKETKSYGPVPELPENSPTGVVLFAGGGGVESGMVMAGIRPLISVEFNPEKPDLSRSLAQWNHLNFKPFGSRVLKLSVERFAALGIHCNGK